MQASEPRTEPVPAELPTVSDGIAPFGIRIHRPVPARVLRAHTFAIARVVLLVTLAVGGLLAVTEPDGTPTLVLAGAAVLIGLAGFVARLRVRRALRSDRPGLEVVISANVLKISQPSQLPHYLLRRDVQTVLDLGSQLNLVHGDRQTVVGASLEGWDDLRARLRAWGPVEKRSQYALWFWAMTPLATLLLSMGAWLARDRSTAAVISGVAVLLGLAMAFRIGTSRILPTKQKVIGVLRALVFALGAIGRLAIFAQGLAKGERFDSQPPRSWSHR